MRRLIFCVAFSLLGSTLSPRGQAQEKPPRPREAFKNSTAQYDWVTNSAGQHIRTIVTKPKGVNGKVPAIFFVGWLSCDSVEYPAGETDPFGAIFWRLIEQSGFATMRMDKPGVGESEGNCATTDFQTELESYRAAFISLKKYPFLDQDSVFVIGLSNGGGTAPLIVGQQQVRGFLAASSWGRTWYEHMLELERVRLSQDSRTTSAQVNEAMKGFTDFYALYLMRNKTPGELLKEHPEWRTIWYDELEPEGQYGRPAAFYQQLQGLNLGKVWQEVSAPVLVMHGTADTVMSRADSVAIADSVNRAHPGQAQFFEVEGGNHALGSHGTLAETVIPKMLEWMRKQLSMPK